MSPAGTTFSVYVYVSWNRHCIYSIHEVTRSTRGAKKKRKRGKSKHMIQAVSLLELMSKPSIPVYWLRSTAKYASTCLDGPHHMEHNMAQVFLTMDFGLASLIYLLLSKPFWSSELLSVFLFRLRVFLFEVKANQDVNYTLVGGASADYVAAFHPSRNSKKLWVMLREDTHIS